MYRTTAATSIGFAELPTKTILRHGTSAVEDQLSHIGWIRELLQVTIFVSVTVGLFGLFSFGPLPPPPSLPWQRERSSLRPYIATNYELRVRLPSGPRGTSTASAAHPTNKAVAFGDQIRGPQKTDSSAPSYPLLGAADLRPSKLRASSGSGDLVMQEFSQTPGCKASCSARSALRLSWRACRVRPRGSPQDSCTRTCESKGESPWS